MLKEIEFEVPGARVSRPDLRYAVEAPGAEARELGCQLVDGVARAVLEMRGDASALQEFGRHMEERWAPPLLDIQVLQRQRQRLVYAARWRRPAAPGEGVSLHHLAHDHLGPGGLVFTHAARGRLRCQAAGEDGAALRRLLAAVGGDWGPPPRLIYAGPFRGPWRADDIQGARLAEEDARIVTEALSRGYYDNPKGCGVRELAECLGVSKSAVARRLRSAERRALTAAIEADGPRPPEAHHQLPPF